MVGEALAGLSALKTAFDLAKGLKDITDVANRNAAVIELQEKILTAQSAQASLVERISELEEKVAGFETWDAEKKRYVLTDMGLGTLVYALKDEETSVEHAHCICTACFQHRKRSILQPDSEGWYRGLKRPECKTFFKTEMMSFSAASDLTPRRRF
jgi:hypothetical protein